MMEPTAAAEHWAPVIADVQSQLDSENPVTLAADVSAYICTIMLQLFNDILQASLESLGGGTTLMLADVDAACQHLLPRELYLQARNEGRKATTRVGNGNPTGGLTPSCYKAVEALLRQAGHETHILAVATLVGNLEYLLVEILDISGRAALKTPVTLGPLSMMTLSHVHSAVTADEELSKLLSSIAPAEAKAAAGEAEVAHGGTDSCVLAWSVSSAVTEWDEETFTDCRPSEAAETRQDHEAAATAQDSHGVDPSVIDGVEAANFAARRLMVSLLGKVSRGSRSLTLLSGPLPAAEQLLEGLAQFVDVTVESQTDAGPSGRVAYEHTVRFTCDVPSADLHNVVSTVVKVRVASA